MNLQLSSGKKSILLIVFILFYALSFSQSGPDNQKSDFWNNVRFGGGVGLSFGDGFFSGTLAPTAIYQVSNNVGLGIGLNGTYNTRRDLYKSTILGGSAMALYDPLNELQVSAEFEELNVNRKYESNLNLQDDNYWYPALFLGAGYRAGNVIFGIRYDVLYDEDRSIYADPWIPFVRVFF
ncbi:MAG: alpha-ketoglutarate decarboxylase [Bacteroidia bacterium]|nr:alpha-ketoglutarate decarboxylase [Bacteroidia bacterium]MBT8310583.1 alpha-ketoglutarate decarboxylase [Bacteroidia bacterium]NND10641.1 alpha-ketoglutarate decarboxylase [Flavobacteriaceae bacterium]NNK26802.1 alpha-ketoglutarate decarboxylase [Flavobacteriaceae bacterium]NNL61253.1 alpha-ketoglutarate decarboxylase [Flavobacteriaceae bacterium]